MAERKAVNKYYPPDWDPTKGSINKHVGQHPLRDRARKLGQGILIIRFEMPYNIWCGGCGSHIGMGVRYNAEKKKVGNYYSTPIYKFRMKCHLCDNHFEIQTDPKNHDYVILCGAKRKEQRWDPKQNEQVVPEDKATQKKLATDAMFKLEHGSDDQNKGKSVVSTLSQLADRRELYKDDYILNKIAREKFRNEKKRIKEEKAVDLDLLKKSSLDIDLVKETEEDIRLAGLLKYRTTESYDEKQLQKRKEIELRPIFQKPPGETESPTGGPAKNVKQQFASKLAFTQRSPFDNITTSKTEPGRVLKALGVRRKSLIKPLSESSHESQPSSDPTTSEVGPMEDIAMTSNICDVDDVSGLRNDHGDRTGNAGCDVDVDKQHSDVTSVTSPSSNSIASGMGLGLVSVYTDSSSEDSDVT